MRRPARSLALLALAGLLAGPAWSATAWTTDAATSRLSFVATQAGGEFEGRFERFAPEIVFDPADLAHSRFIVQVETASAATGDQDRDNTLKGKDFFASAQWPKARFETRSFRATGSGGYEASGRLTLRDVTRDVRVPFTFKPAADGRTATLVGGTTVLRLDYGVGQGEWADTQWVGNEVRIRFDLRLTRATP